MTVANTQPAKRVLGIETSCDETAVAVYDAEQGLMAHLLHSQVDLHRQWGGVVPELASRDHVRKIIPLIDAVLQQAHSDKTSIDAIAYTQGPGLIGALMVGASVACSLAYAWQVPAIAVHHLEAHLMAVMLEQNKPLFPFLALLVSGGHTQLIEAKAFGNYRILGETLDDAVGEAFDKTAKLLGLPYPGGPALAALAMHGKPGRFCFSRPMLHHKTLDMSFSGLKTQVATLYRQQKNPDQQIKADIAHAFQEAVVDSLRVKCEKALQQTDLKQLAVVGGVGANKRLRAELAAKLSAEVFYPSMEFCTDNGAMVALLGAMELSKTRRLPRQTAQIQVYPRWNLQAVSEKS